MEPSNPQAGTVSLADAMLGTKIGEGRIPTAEAAELLAPEKVAAFEVQLKELQDNLEANLPGYKDALKKVDKILKANPEITYVLKPEQIGVITRGLIKEADLQLFSKETKAKSTKKLEYTGEDDI